MSGRFMVSDAGEGICSVCNQWGPEMLNAAVNSPQGAVIIGTAEGVPRQACKDCIEKMVMDVIEESQRRHGHDPNGPIPNQTPT